MTGHAPGPPDRVHFYPHPSLRDCSLDTIRHWPEAQVANPGILRRPPTTGVSAPAATRGGVARPWFGRLPLPNVKRRPADAEPGAVVYVWGGVTLTGRFIVELENPYALVGYNLGAMRVWRSWFRAVLLSERCAGIRCMSRACRATLRALFGDAVADKAGVHYPHVLPRVEAVARVAPDGPRFLFVGSQFEMKGGPALLRAFRRVGAALPGARLDVVTHLPDRYRPLADQPGVTVHAATLTRVDLWSGLMASSDVLVHPTYVDSFGMVALEAMAHGLALVATDVYALAEMVEEGRTGYLLPPPVSIWDGVMPSRLYHVLHRASEVIGAVETGPFETALAGAMIAAGGDPDRLLALRRASLALVSERFAP